MVPKLVPFFILCFGVAVLGDDSVNSCTTQQCDEEMSALQVAKTKIGKKYVDKGAQATTPNKLCGGAGADGRALGGLAQCLSSWKTTPGGEVYSGCIQRDVDTRPWCLTSAGKGYCDCDAVTLLLEVEVADRTWSQSWSSIYVQFEVNDGWTPQRRIGGETNFALMAGGDVSRDTFALAGWPTRFKIFIDGTDALGLGRITLKRWHDDELFEVLRSDNGHSYGLNDHWIDGGTSAADNEKIYFVPTDADPVLHMGIADRTWAGSGSQLTVNWKVNGGWTQRVDIGDSDHDRGETHVKTFTNLAAWPTELELKIHSTNAIGFRSLSVERSGKICPILVSDNGQAYGNNNFWIDGNEEASSTLRFPIGPCQDFVPVTDPEDENPLVAVEVCGGLGAVACAAGVEDCTEIRADAYSFLDGHYGDVNGADDVGACQKQGSGCYHRTSFERSPIGEACAFLTYDDDPDPAVINPPPPPPLVFCRDTLPFNLNNMNAENPLEIRFSNVLDGQATELVVRYQEREGHETYVPANPARNEAIPIEVGGSDARFAQLSLLCGNTYTFQFSIENTPDNAPLDSFAFSIYDIDQGAGDRGREKVTVCGAVPVIPTNSELVSITDANCYSFQSATRGNRADNPRNPRTLTPLQIARSVSWQFYGRSSFEVTFELGTCRHGRNVMFAMDPLVACYGDQD